MSTFYLATGDESYKELAVLTYEPCLVSDGLDFLELFPDQRQQCEF